MKNLGKNLICLMLTCLFMANIIFNTNNNVTIAKEATISMVDFEPTEEEPEVDIEALDIPMVGSSIEGDDNEEVKQNVIVQCASEIDECQYEAENGKIKEKEVGLNDYGFKNTAYASTKVDPYPGYFTAYMDLSCRNTVTVDDMNEVIDHWLNGRDSKLKDQGKAFITASKETGLDPVFLLSLAAQEGGWTVSNLHASKNNPYSINMVDSNPSQGYHLGNEYGEGIVNGAKWIKEHYYDEGQTTLNSMIYGHKKYSSSEDKWINDISNIMTRSYNYILNN